MIGALLVDRPRGALEPLRPVRGCSAVSRVHEEHLARVREAKREAERHEGMDDLLAEVGTKTWAE